ncbi:MAG: hypothetical protein J5673_06180 [Candidatus Methanomethylophilaceae archaeon]|nr:hypothetical protein [Candidatus Methanomethylophilaceae archaeon]
MDAKAERIMTIVVVAIVAAMLISLVLAVVMYKNGDMSDDSIFMIGMLFSASITVIVVVYGAIVLNNGNSASDMYRKYVEEREKEKRQ